jgi:hypothetical protein
MPAGRISCGADGGARVVDRQRGPECELRLQKMERVPEGWKNQQGDRIQNKNRAEGYRHFFFIGLKNGTIAAMALPPQIAVPAVIRIDELPRTCKSLPSARPTRSAKEIPSAV